MHSYAQGSYAKSANIGAADAFGEFVSLPAVETDQRTTAFHEMGQPELVENAPANYARSLETLSTFHSLGSNWDSYGARPISEHAIFAARSTLRSVLSNNSIAPDVIPTSAGGVQLEWEADDRVVEIKVAPDGTAVAYVDDGSIEAEGPLGVLLAKVISAVAKMSPAIEPEVPGVTFVMPKAVRMRHSAESVFGQVAYA